jgi:hypothetical protein
MQRHRTIAAAPVRSASEAWQVVISLLTDTLERSPAIPTGSVASELAPMAGLGPALIAAGHLQVSPLLLVDQSIHLSITVATGDAALEVDEHLNPVPGGTSATANWTLHLPAPIPLAEAVAGVVAGSAHLSTETPPSEATGDTSQKASANGGLVNLDVLRQLGSRP